MPKKVSDIEHTKAASVFLNVWVSVIARAKDVSVQLKFARANSARAQWIPVFVPALLEPFNKIVQKLRARM